MSELKNVTKEQLIGMGLSEEEANAMLKTLNQNGESTKIPLPIAKINYDDEIKELHGCLIANPIYEGKGDDRRLVGVEHNFGRNPEIVILKTATQYSKYDDTQKKSIVSSNILPEKTFRSKYIDMISKKPITELKWDKDGNVIDPDIIFHKLLLIKAKDIKTNEWVHCIWYIKKGLIYAFNEYVNTSDYINKRIIFDLAQKRKGQVKYFVAENFNLTKLSETEMFKNIKIDAENINKFDKWINLINSRINEINEIEEVIDEADEADEIVDNF